MLDAVAPQPPVQRRLTSAVVPRLGSFLFHQQLQQRVDGSRIILNELFGRHMARAVFYNMRAHPEVDR